MTGQGSNDTCLARFIYRGTHNPENSSARRKKFFIKYFHLKL